MPYSNDVFISYRREDYAWTPWARDIFKPALNAWLQRELGNAPDIFIDEQVPVGADYVESLARALATSKVMVAILSKDYFRSDWCIHELDLMMERAGGRNLIIPIVVHDGEVIPDAVHKLQHADFKRFANPALSVAGSLHAEFWEAIRVIAPRVRDAIAEVPAYDSRWIAFFRQRLTHVYNASQTGKNIPLPTQFSLKNSSPPKVPPRLRV